MKLHEDWVTTPAVIDNSLAVADRMDVQILLHPDTLNESGFVENTLAAFAHSTELGVDVLEMDLRQSRDGVPIILPEHLRTPVALRIQSACAEHDIEEVCIYSQPVTRAVTYIADPSTRSDTVAGGHPPAYRKR